MSKTTRITVAAVAAVCLTCGSAAWAATALQEALDSNLTFTTSGNAAWQVDSTNASSGGGSSSARSGSIGNSQTSVLSAEVMGPNVLHFWWKVSCEQPFDGLILYLDGASQGFITGEQDWAEKTLTIPSGVHTVSWTYSKDSDESAGSDAGWVDNIYLERVMDMADTQTVYMIASPPSLEYWAVTYNLDVAGSPDWTEHTGSDSKTFEQPADQWMGTYLYADSSYIAAKYTYRFAGDASQESSRNVSRPPDFLSAELNPGESLMFSASSACDISARGIASGYVYAYNFDSGTQEWQAFSAAGTGSQQTVSVMTEVTHTQQWVGMYLYDTALGAFEEETLYLYQEDLTP